MKKIIKLVEPTCNGRTVRELRSLLRGIDSGEIVNVAFVISKRNKTMKTYYDYDCASRALGDVELLKNYIITKSFDFK